MKIDTKENLPILLQDLPLPFLSPVFFFLSLFSFLFLFLPNRVVHLNLNIF